MAMAVKVQMPARNPAVAPQAKSVLTTQFAGQSAAGLAKQFNDHLAD